MNLSIAVGVFRFLSLFFLFFFLLFVNFNDDKDVRGFGGGGEGGDPECTWPRDKPSAVINRQPKCFADRLTIRHGRGIKVHGHLNSSQLPFNFITSGTRRPKIRRPARGIIGQILENLLAGLIRGDEQRPEEDTWSIKLSIDLQIIFACKLPGLARNPVLFKPMIPSNELSRVIYFPSRGGDSFDAWNKM